MRPSKAVAMKPRLKILVLAGENIGMKESVWECQKCGKRFATVLKGKPKVCPYACQRKLIEAAFRQIEKGCNALKDQLLSQTESQR